MSISEDFKEQNKKYNFRDEELKKYRKEVEEKITNEDLNERYKKLPKKEFKKRVINEKKIEERGKTYGLKNYFFDVIPDKKGEDNLIFRNGKGEIITKVKYDKNKKFSENKEFLLNRLSKEKFDFGKYYIKEDSEPKQNKVISVIYNSFYRYGILIYRYKNGRKYELIYQSSDSQAQSEYISYQRIIAEIKQEILSETNISLEEWIYLSRVRKDIYIEGGIRFKRYKHTKEKDKAMKRSKSPEYEVHIDFSDI